MLTNLQIININSEHRTNQADSISNFEYEIKYRGHIDFVGLTYCCIPKTYYLLESGFNTFTLTENGTPRTITTPPGNYAFNTFRTTLLSLLNSGGLGYTYTMVKDDVTGKYTFGVSSSNPVSFTFPAAGNMHRLLGFDDESTNSFVAQYLTSTDVCQFTRTSSIIIKSDIVDSDNSKQPVLSVVPVINAVDFSYITYQEYNAQYKIRHFNGKDKTVFRFTLFDTDGNIINLNNTGSVIMELVLFKKAKLDVLRRAYYEDQILKEMHQLDLNKLEEADDQADQ